MAVHNRDIAATFEEIADLLEIQGANPFRVRAYRNAARTLDGLGKDIAPMIARGEELPHLPGIGEDLSAKIHEIVETGRCKALDKLRGEVPKGLPELLRLPGLGPKRVKALHDELGIHSLDALRTAAAQGRIRDLAGFGAKTEQAVLEALERHQAQEKRFLLATAEQYALAYRDYLRERAGIGEVEIAGSFRRGRETVGDLDILVTARPDAKATDAFVAYEEVERVLAHGGTRASVVLRSGIQVDLRVLPKKSYGAALVYFTGSKAHNIVLRRLAQERGLKISEYGVLRGDEQVAGASEESVYGAVDLPWIPPELREDRGEIEAARAGRLPRLVERKDLRGDLHSHTSASDGRSSLEDMAEAARAAGLEYLAITEHSKRLAMANGLDRDRLLRQGEEIDRLNQRLKGITLLKGIEVDILKDGSLDLDDEVLGTLDLVVASVHGGFRLSRDKQTARVLKALDRPHLSILGHPSGRLLERRAGLDIDLERVIDKAAERGCFLELNANPERLDLNDVYCRMAEERGVLVAINSDAHSTLQFRHLRYGILQARRGWLEADDVLNTRPLPELRKLLARTM